MIISCPLAGATSTVVLWEIYWLEVDEWWLLLLLYWLLLLLLEWLILGLKGLAIVNIVRLFSRWLDVFRVCQMFIWEYFILSQIDSVFFNNAKFFLRWLLQIFRLYDDTLLILSIIESRWPNCFCEEIILLFWLWEKGSEDTATTSDTTCIAILY